MCLQRRRLYDNQLIINRILVRRFCIFFSCMCTTFHLSCRVQFSFLHKQYTILNAIKECYFRNRKLKTKKKLKIMTFTINDQILQFNFIFEIYLENFLVEWVDFYLENSRPSWILKLVKYIVIYETSLEPFFDWILKSTHLTLNN